MERDAVKMFVAAACAALWSYARQIVVPLIVLIVVMMIDYISGVLAAWANDELDSRTGIIGIVKKLSYLALVVVGCVIDWLISMLGSQLGGAEVTIRAIGLVVICWLIINELISILENVARQGGPVPPWIAGLLGHLKRAAEASVPQIPDVSESDHEEVGKHERRD